MLKAIFQLFAHVCSRGKKEKEKLCIRYEKMLNILKGKCNMLKNIKAIPLRMKQKENEETILFYITWKNFNIRNNNNNICLQQKLNQIMFIKIIKKKVTTHN